MCSKGSNWQWVSIPSGNALALNRHPSITRSNDDWSSVTIYDCTWPQWAKSTHRYLLKSFLLEIENPFILHSQIDMMIMNDNIPFLYDIWIFYDGVFEGVASHKQLYLFRLRCINASWYHSTDLKGCYTLIFMGNQIWKGMHVCKVKNAKCMELTQFIK